MIRSIASARRFSLAVFTHRWIASTATIAVALMSSCGNAKDAGGPPNIVLIVADDLGWNDVGYHGSGIRTPSIDRLAREGVELDRFYAAPVCSPTRAGLLTGRYPIRFGLMRSVVTPWRRYGLDPGETTVAEALESLGYRHRAIFGKWHLGHLSRRWHPLQQGFTHFRGHYNGAIDYYTHQRLNEPDWHVDYETRNEPGYSTDLIADGAARFIRDKAKERPFFCYVAFNAPHEPLQAPEKYTAMYKDKRGEERVAAAMITCLDDGIARILDAIDDAGIRDNTLVWFLSDNGGIAELHSNNLPLRGDKGDVFEGGVRVPACVRWPAGFGGGQNVAAPTAYIDIMPTLLQAAGRTEYQDMSFDGIGLLGVLRGEEPAPDRDVYTYISLIDPESEGAAVITTEWKLTVTGPEISRGIGARHSVMLFDIANDPGETTDVASQHPDVVYHLKDRLGHFLELEPVDAIPRFFDGRDGFVPPRNWRIPDE